MVDIKEKLNKIIDKIDLGLYFTINRVRQYGKTTVLSRLYNILKDKYIIIPEYASKYIISYTLANLLKDSSIYNLKHAKG